MINILPGDFYRPLIFKLLSMAEGIKNVGSYAIWIYLSVIMGFVHMFVVLGPNTAGSEGIDFWFDIIYKVALIKVGLIVGGIIAILFILVDFMLLRRSSNIRRHIITSRILTIIILTIVVGSTHYLLEKTFDLI